MPKRWITDTALTVVLLLLMGYSLIGETAHEWLGISMLALAVLHHKWNWAWCKSLGKGRISAYRAVQSILACLLLFSVVCSLLSGMVLSRYVLGFWTMRLGQDLAAAPHLPCAFWSFLLTGLHLGLHWGSVKETARRITGIRIVAGKWTVVLRLAGGVIACYGLTAFFRNAFLDYLMMKSHFLFVPPGQTAAGFLADYLAILSMFVWIGYYGGNILRGHSGRKKVIE